MSTKYSLIKKHLLAFLSQEVKKTSLTNVVFGLSGGIDSAVVAVLAREVFGKNALAIMLPSPYSSESSVADAKELCGKFDINYKIINIKPFVNAYTNHIDTKPNNIDLGNLCARIRMCLIYDESSKQKALVVGTSNKTELLLGYGTIFGDLSSAINPIGDLYKTEIFEFARYLDIPQTIIDKTPSADLWSGQSDESDLGYTYEQIDSLLKEMIDNRIKKDVLQNTFDKKMIDDISNRIFSNQFKRKMPIIAKINQRTIGYDFLYPRDINL